MGLTQQKLCEIQRYDEPLPPLPDVGLCTISPYFANGLRNQHGNLTETHRNLKLASTRSQFFTIIQLSSTFELSLLVAYTRCQGKCSWRRRHDVHSFAAMRERILPKSLILRPFRTQGTRNAERGAMGVHTHDNHKTKRVHCPTCHTWLHEFNLYMQITTTCWLWDEGLINWWPLLTSHKVYDFDRILYSIIQITWWCVIKLAVILRLLCVILLFRWRMKIIAKHIFKSYVWFANQFCYGKENSCPISNSKCYYHILSIIVNWFSYSLL